MMSPGTPKIPAGAPATSTTSVPNPGDQASAGVQQKSPDVDAPEPGPGQEESSKKSPAKDSSPPEQKNDSDEEEDNKSAYNIGMQEYENAMGRSKDFQKFMQSQGVGKNEKNEDIIANKIIEHQELIKKFIGEENTKKLIDAAKAHQEKMAKEKENKQKEQPDKLPDEKPDDPNATSIKP